MVAFYRGVLRSVIDAFACYFLIGTAVGQPYFSPLAIAWGCYSKGGRAPLGSLVSRLSLGGVSVVCPWYLSGVSVVLVMVPWWCSVSVVSRWCLGCVLVV